MGGAFQKGEGRGGQKKMKSCPKKEGWGIFFPKSLSETKPDIQSNLEKDNNQYPFMGEGRRAIPTTKGWGGKRTCEGAGRASQEKGNCTFERREKKTSPQKTEEKDSGLTSLDSCMSGRMKGRKKR